ncbi:MAG: cupredoxin domain-containing protein [Dehalococcoidia bacterium]
MKTYRTVPPRRIVLAAVLGLGAGSALLVGCSDDSAPAALVSTKAPDEVVRVSLQEWSVLPGMETVGKGVIQFAVDNRGADVHEFVLLKDGEELGEIEGIGSGHLETIRFELKPGKYELACLIKETEANGEVEDHYELGMHTAFEVR